MASKLSGNGVWEGSRMMIPEHVQGYNEQMRNEQRRPRIELDEQELEQISRALQQSMKYKLQLSIRMYDPFETLRIIGVVDNISRMHGQFKVDGEWFNIDDVEAVELEDVEPC